MTPSHVLSYLKNTFSGLGRSLFLWFFFISVIPLAFVGWRNYLGALDMLQVDTERSLAAVLKLKKAYLEGYFTERLKDLEIQSGLDANVLLLQELEKALADSDQTALDFVRSYQWAAISSDYGGDLRDFAHGHGYRDVLLIDREGHILFSIMSGPDLGSNVFRDNTGGDNLGRAAVRALDTGFPYSSDFLFYQPSDGALAMFLFQTMVDQEGEKIGLMAFEAPIYQIDEIMHENTGLGETGESFLVGADLLMRSDSRFSEEATVLKETINTEVMRLWREGGARSDPGKDRREKALFYVNARGRAVLGMYTPLEQLQKLGLNWAIVAELEEGEAFAPGWALRDQILSMLLIVIGLVLILVVFVTHRIASPLRRISGWAKRVAVGDLTEPDFKLPSNEIGELKRSFSQVADTVRDATNICELIAVGDIEQPLKDCTNEDRLSRSVNQMIENLRAVVHQTEAVARGDFSSEIKPRSDRDFLGLALMNMTTALSRLRDDKSLQDWEKAGEAELNARMRGEHDLQALCRKIIEFLADNMKAGVGAIYIMTEDDRLHLMAGYAYRERKELSNSFQMGEGLVGQAALEGETIVMNRVPEDYVRIESGLGHGTPRQIMATPFFFENEIMGVVELGTFDRFSKTEVQFLEKIAPDLGIAINTAQSRTRMAHLLKQTQEQAGALKQGQEELRAANRGLEEQTQALRQSEAELQNQQEELQQTNEELEERTEALEVQRDEIKRKNLELEKARNEITQKARDLEQTSTYKSQFLANMSHELRTPLNSLLILAQMLQANKEENLTDKQVNFARTIYQSGSDLLHLINEILDLSKIEAGQMTLHFENMGLPAFFEELHNRFDHVAGKKGLSFTTGLDDKAPEGIQTDRQRVNQIVVNMLSNAFKFTEQGKVSLRIYQPAPDTDLSISGLTWEQAVAISVEDTGLGIPDDKQQRIFEAFQQADGTTSRKFGGTGLGLSISRELARLLKGELQLKSVYGEGSTFTLYLPVTHPDARDLPGPAQGVVETQPAPTHEMKNPPVVPEPKVETTELKGLEEQTPEGFPLDDRKNIEPNNRCLLVIEDDPKFARIMLNLSRERGFRCILAEDGETGLYLADYFKPHAIVLDIGLPRMNGLAVLSRLKDNPDTRPIPVHVVSGYDKDLETRKMGAIGYLNKPASLADIDLAFNKIDTVLASSVKSLLIVENNPDLKDAILSSIQGRDLEIKTVKSGLDGLAELRRNAYDALIMDLDLPDQLAKTLLETIRSDKTIPWLPIIVFTNRPISEDEKGGVDPFVESVIVKPDRIPERILDETILFLHRVESDLDENQRDILRMIHDKEAIFKDREILIVDDDMRNVFALTSALEDKGVKVIVGRNGREGLEKLKANPGISLVLMDIMMPEMDGYEAIAAIRKMEEFKELPIIALTAKAMKTDRRKSIDAGANDYMTKPLDTVKLFSLMRVWLY